jgi:peptide methionine sulfoxide reductase MsrA
MQQNDNWKKNSKLFFKTYFSITSPLKIVENDLDHGPQFASKIYKKNTFEIIQFFFQLLV